MSENSEQLMYILEISLNKNLPNIKLTNKKHFYVVFRSLFFLDSNDNITINNCFYVLLLLFINSLMYAVLYLKTQNVIIAHHSSSLALTKKRKAQCDELLKNICRFFEVLFLLLGRIIFKLIKSSKCVPQFLLQQCIFNCTFESAIVEITKWFVLIGKWMGYSYSTPQKMKIQALPLF